MAAFLPSALITATVLSSAFNLYISGRAGRIAEAWALAAVITGFAGLSAVLIAQLLHHTPSNLVVAGGLGTFAACELIAIRAAYEARSTQLGRWVLASTAWPLVLLAVLHVGRLFKSLAAESAL